MKLQKQFVVTNKQLRDLNYVKKVKVLEKTLNRKCLDYPTQENCLVCWDWLFINHFSWLISFINIHQFINKRG